MKVTFRCDPALDGLLPRPAPSRAALPDWLRRMKPEADSDLHPGPVRTVKHCPPFIDAMTHGFVLPLPCDVTVAGGRLSWDWAVPKLGATLHPRAPIAFHAPAQVEGTPFHAADQVVVKFNLFWTVALEPGWSLFVCHPANRFDLPFQALSGLVDADTFHDVGVLFPAVWTDRAFDGVLARGTPVVQCVPVRRETLELAFETFSPADVARYQGTAGTLLGGPGHYRRRFRASRPRGEGASEIAGVEEETPAGGRDQRLGDPPEGSAT